MIKADIRLLTMNVKLGLYRIFDRRSLYELQRFTLDGKVHACVHIGMGIMLCGKEWQGVGAPFGLHENGPVTCEACIAAANRLGSLHQ